MMRRLVVLRMMFLLPQGGGVIPDYKMISVPDWPFPQTAGSYFLTVTIALFFTYFAYGTFRRIWSEGWRAIGGFTGVVHNLNILMFWVAWGLRFAAYYYLPVATEGLMHSDTFVSLRSYAELIRMSIIVKACNSFLCWFKIVTHLSLEPKFALVTSTLARSASHISAFIFIFVILGYAFASCFLLTFGDSMSTYRSLLETSYSMLRGLLGDFNLNSMQEAHWLMGPFLFLGFVSVAVFVILNLIIAIISDSYMEAQESLQGQEEVQLGKEMGAFAEKAWTRLKDRMWQMPGIGRICRHVAKVVPDDRITATLQKAKTLVVNTESDKQESRRKLNNHMSKIRIDQSNFSRSTRAISEDGVSTVDAKRGSIAGVSEDSRRGELKELLTIVASLKADMNAVRHFQDTDALRGKDITLLKLWANRARTATNHDLISTLEAQEAQQGKASAQAASNDYGKDKDEVREV